MAKEPEAKATEAVKSESVPAATVATPPAAPAAVKPAAVASAVAEQPKAPTGWQLHVPGESEPRQFPGVECVEDAVRALNDANKSGKVYTAKQLNPQPLG